MPRLTSTQARPARARPAPAAPAVVQAPADLAWEVATVLGGMTYQERLRAYRAGVFSRRELSIAAAWLPGDMPILNGEYEWIAASLADLD